MFVLLVSSQLMYCRFSFKGNRVKVLPNPRLWLFLLRTWLGWTSCSWRLYVHHLAGPAESWESTPSPNEAEDPCSFGKGHWGLKVTALASPLLGSLRAVKPGTPSRPKGLVPLRRLPQKKYNFGSGTQLQPLANPTPC